uniref:C2H2-type domain-containing protein n=1 Tax=Gopherus evgoodei TaxID=1825980 RepID=A0A8C4WN57_9SAUR
MFHLVITVNYPVFPTLKLIHNLNTGVFVTSNTNFDLQCEDEDLEFYSSEELQGGLSEGDENIILVDAFDEEDLEPITGEALPYRCKKCGASFQELGELKEHNQIHLTEHSYRCPICSKEFFRAANLRMHKLIHSSDRPHKCPECDKGFIRTADVWRHLRNVHKIERSKVVLGNGMVRNPWSTLHQKKHGSEDTDQQCFRKPNLLKRHQQTHSGERPFYCEECGGTFTRLASLQRHQRIHTGEKPYSCAYCGHSFTESGTLRRHERTHKVDKS